MKAIRLKTLTAEVTKEVDLKKSRDVAEAVMHDVDVPSVNANSGPSVVGGSPVALIEPATSNGVLAQPAAVGGV